MVDTTKRNRELVADPPAQRPRLCKSQMVGVGRPAPAQQARLRCHELQMRTIAIAARFTQRESAFINRPGNGIVHAVFSRPACRRPKGRSVCLGSRAVRMRLGAGFSYAKSFPERPPRMHWRTYLRMRAGE
jgi:hypothetical protein